MAWNPFKSRADKAAPPTDAPTSFESTVIEDRSRSMFDAHHLAQAIGAEASEGASFHAIGVVGRYLLRSVLGEGGLGTVYGGWDPLLSRRVAVKTLNRWAPGGDDQTGSDYILNEARAAARLSHPHIVTVFDAGNSDQGVYIAMEWMQGLDLRQMLRQGWKPNYIEATVLVGRVADALAYAHGKGVIHCDIKPGNIFMVDRRVPKVLDFGIARVARRDGRTTVGAAAGSPHYLSPEQLQHGTIDRRCDVYSLGVVLFELLVGAPPYTGQTVEQIASSVLEAPQPLAHRVEPGIPKGLSAIVEKAMARSPDERYPSARHLSAALREWRLSPEAAAISQQAQRGNGQRSLSMLMLLSLLLALAGGALWWDLLPSALTSALGWINR